MGMSSPIFYFIIKSWEQAACLPVGGLKASLKIYRFNIKPRHLGIGFHNKLNVITKNRFKGSGDLDSSTICVCGIMSIWNMPKSKPIFLRFSTRGLKKWAKCILRQPYFILRTSKYNHSICLLVYCDFNLSDRIKRITKIKYFRTFLRERGLQILFVLISFTHRFPSALLFYNNTGLLKKTVVSKHRVFQIFVTFDKYFLFYKYFCGVF